MTQPVIHRLAEKNLLTNTAVCSECGLVGISRSGLRGWQCANKKAATKREWAAKNPEKAKASRSRRSEHELFGRDYVKQTAHCVICGPVTMTPWGRGYACGTRAAELRTKEQAAPQKRCDVCWVVARTTVWLRASGHCPACARATSAAAQRAESAYDAWQGAGFSIHADDDYEDDRQPAVPGWRTIGSDRPWNEV